MMKGIEYNGKHSYRDFGLTIAERHIGNPSKIKRKQRVPFSNVEYDLSTIYGDQEYGNRELMYKFNVINPRNQTKEYFTSLKIAVLNWLLETNALSKLYDDSIPGYYFMAEVDNGPDLEENTADGTITAIFNAYPFKISELREGNDIWDTFNFLLDYAQITEFTISGTDEVVLYNPGTPNVTPTIISSSTFTIKQDNITYSIPQGQTKSDDFVLRKGGNKLTITGNGTIEFLFYKELI